MNTTISRLLWMLLLMTALSFKASAVVYVTTTGAGTHSGTSWANAKNIYEATNPMVYNNEYWLKGGTYNNGGSQFFATFQSSVYGGFNGTETLRSQRNPAINITILQDFTNGGIAFDYYQNCDGITFKNSPVSSVRGDTITNCIFDNSFIYSTSVGGNGNIFTDCVFKNHSGPRAAVTLTNNGKGIFTRCLFKDNNNTATSYGGAVSIGVNTWGEFYECIFDHNTATAYGGAIAFDDPSGYNSVVNCLFKNNTAVVGSAIYIFKDYAPGSFVQVLESTFVNNTATAASEGCALFVASNLGFVLFANNIVWGNTSSGNWLRTVNLNSTPSFFYNFQHNIVQDDISANPDVFSTSNTVVNPVLNPDFTLSSCSPAINASIQTIPINPSPMDGQAGRTTDLAGNLRIYNSSADLGCYEFQTSVPALPSVGITVTPSATVCAGSIVTLSGTGATAYTWNNGITNGIGFVPLSSVTYTVTGTNAIGCTGTATQTVTVNPLPTVGSTVSPSATVCGGTSVTLNGTGASNYIWSGGVTNGIAFIPSSTSTYTVSVTGANGCTNTASQTITVNPLPTVGATVSPSATVCAGTSVTLNGTGASNYIWSGGISNGIAFIPSSTSTYTVSVTGANGCTNTASQTITVNPLPTVGATVSPSATVCAGTSVTLNGTGASNYIWSGGVTNGIAFIPSSTSTYTVSVTGANGCTNTASQSITVNPLPTVGATVFPSSVVCTGASATLNGTGANTYSWSGGITNGVAFTPSSTMTYTVTGTNANGCTNTATQTITVNPLPAATASNVSGCAGTAVALSGSPAGGSFSVNNPFTGPGSTYSYTYHYTDGNGCMGTSAPATITFNPIPTIGATVSPSPAICSGTSVTLSGTGGNTYTWSGGITNGVAFTPSSTSAYTVTGTGANGCSGNKIWVKIESGENHSLGIKADGSLWAWGENTNGQLGNGTNTNSSTPVQVGTQTDWKDISAGQSHSLAIKSNGTAWSWGKNDKGQLGNNSTVNSNVPVQVNGLSIVTGISAGALHSLFLKNDGTAWACGFNPQGELGDGTLINKHTPVQVLSNVTAVAAGGYHSIFLFSNGTVRICGFNGYGALGDGTNTDKHTPALISSLSNIIAVSGGEYHSVFLKSDGTVRACGYNANGELGDGSQIDKNTPVQTISLNNVTAIATGKFHSLFIKSDATAWGCGYNLSRQLGDGTFFDRYTSVQVGGGLTNVLALAGGSAHSLFLKSDGSASSCGLNSSGQYGDGTTSNSVFPVQVINPLGISVTVTVAPSPAPGISGTLSFCSGSSTTLDLGSGYDSYNWSNGATTQTINVTTAGSWSGTVTLNGCSGTSSPVSTTVNASVTPVISGALSFCSGGSTTLDLGAGYSSYSWSNGATTQTINVNSAGSWSGSVTLNGCSGSSSSVSTTVNANPSPVISGTLSFCSGSSTILDLGAGYSSYNWSNGATTQTINVNTAGSWSGTVTLNGCSGTSSSVATTVNASPSPVINGALSFCSGSSTTLDLGAGYNSYSWSNGATTQTINVNTAGSWSGTVTLNGCSGTSSSVTTTVNASPSSVISGTLSFCSGSSTTLDLGAGYNSYSWSNGATTQTINVNTAGSWSGTVTLNGCSGTSSSVTTTVSASPSPVINGALSFCSGSSTTLDLGAGYNSYSWSNGATTQTINANTAGSWSGTVTLNGCSGTSSSVTTTVNASPSPVINGALSFCSGSSTTLDLGAGYSSYSWSNGATTQTINVTTAGSWSGTVTLNGCSGTSPAAVTTINSLPTVSFTGLAASYSASSPTVTLTGSPAGGTFSGPGISGTTFTPSLAGAGGPYTITYSYTNANGCSNSVTHQTTVTNCATPTQPGTISVSGGIAKVCPGNTRTYTTSAASGVTFQWTIPTGATINSGQGTRTINVTYNAGFTANGTMSVVKINGCGSSAPRTLAINRNTPGIPSVINGTATACANSAHPYSVTNVSGMTYTWSATVPSVTFSAGQGTNAVTADFSNAFTTGTMVVNASNGCGTSPDRALAIKSIPDFPGSLSGQSSAVCAGSSYIYNVPNVSGITYNWTPPANAIISSGQGTHNVTVNFLAGFTSGNLSVNGSNVCGTSANRILSITSVPAAPGTMSGGTTYGNCGLTSVPYSVTNVAGVTYTWSVPSGAVITGGQGTNAITVDFTGSVNTGNVQVIASNSCGNSPARVKTVYMKPATPGTIAHPSCVSSGSTGNPFSIAAIASAVSYTWTGPTGSHISDGVITSSSNVLTTTTTSITVNFGTVTASSKISVKANNACGSSAAESLTLVPCPARIAEGEANKFDASVYPNPSPGDFTITVQNGLNVETSISVMDAAGRLVQDIISTTSHSQIRISNLTPGVYSTVLTNGENRKVLKLIKVN